MQEITSTNYLLAAISPEAMFNIVTILFCLTIFMSAFLMIRSTIRLSILRFAKKDLRTLEAGDNLQTAENDKVSKYMIILWSFELIIAVFFMLLSYLMVGILSTENLIVPESKLDTMMILSSTNLAFIVFIVIKELIKTPKNRIATTIKTT